MGEYSRRVLIGNWYETAQLEEYKLNNFLDQMNNGQLLLAKYRKIKENLDSPSKLTASNGTIAFGDKVALLAPHVPATDPPVEDLKGLLLGGRITPNEITNSQDLEDECTVVCMTNKQPKEMNTFIITSADYCNREGELLKYNQEFLLPISSTVAKNKPLYLRYDPDPIPGLCGKYPVFLSKHPVTNARWRVLPVQSPNITRFELEGTPLNVNTDVVINHCFTNNNLGVNIGCWVMGFFGRTCAPLMKTCLDVYGREMPNNIWQIHSPISEN